MSVINQEYKHVFIHVPKTAGTSMESLPCVGGDNHAPAYLILKDIEGTEKASYFSWGFVRNPYDRMVSLYSACVQHSHNEKWLPESARKSFYSFVDWVDDADWGKSSLLYHLLSQSSYLADKALSRVIVDFVGRYETLQDDWRRVCRKLSFPVDCLTLPRLNTTHHPPWPTYYRGPRGHAARAKVYDLYADDFRLFNYDPIILARDFPFTPSTLPFPLSPTS